MQLRQTRHIAKTSFGKIRLGSLPLQEGFFYAAFFCFCMASGLSMLAISEEALAFVSTVKLSLQIFTLFFLALKLLFQRFSSSQLGVACLVGAMVLLSGLKSGDLNLVWMLLFVIAGKEIRFSALAKVAFLCYGLILLFALTGVSLGVAENVTLARSNGSVRSSMGFNHPNQFGLVFFELCLAFAVWRFSRLKATDYVVMLVTMPIVLAVSDSRTSVLGIALLIVSLAFSKAFLAGGHARKVTALFAIVSVVIAFTSFYLMCSYNPADTVHGSLNSAFSDRLYYMNYYYVNYPLTLFGESASSFLTAHSGEGYYYVSDTFVLDNMYCNALFIYGIIPTTMLLLACAGVFLKAWRDDYCGSVIVAFFVMLFFGFSEAVALSFSMNYTFVALSALFYSSSFSSLDTEASE